MNKKLKKMLCLGLCLLLTVGTLFAAENAQAATVYSFKYKGVTATPGKSAKKLLKKAGKAKKVTKDGDYKTYKYKYFTVTTFGDDIAEIKLTSSKVKTREGIRIGSTEKSVIKKYGKNDEYVDKSGSKTEYTYRDDKEGELTIVVKKGKVTSISYFWVIIYTL